MIEILFNIGFRSKEKGLRMLYFINRKGISKIGVCVTKKIRGSVKRNVIIRRIRTAYKSYSKKFFKKKKVIVYFFVYKKNPSLRRLKILMKKILHTI